MEAIAAQLSLGVVIAIITSGSRARKRLGVALSLLSIAVPYLAAPEERAIRFLAAACAITNVFRALDLYFDKRVYSVRARIWHLLAVFDTRRARPMKRTLDGGWVLSACFFSIVMSLGAAAVILINPVDNGTWLLRWLCAAIYVYGSIDLVASLHQVGYRLAGYSVPRLHDHPILSRNLNEFWGRRWNLLVHDLMSRYAFRPLVRRGYGRLGLFAGFLLSALLHMWITVVPLGIAWSLSMASYFVIQGVGILLERPLSVGRWRPIVGRAWTVAWTLLPAPLLLEPIIRMLLSSYAPTPAIFGLS